MKRYNLKIWKESYDLSQKINIGGDKMRLQFWYPPEDLKQMPGVPAFVRAVTGWSFDQRVWLPVIDTLEVR